MNITPVQGNPFEKAAPKLTPVNGNPFESKTSDSPGFAIGTARSALQGATFGFSDEMGAGLSAMAIQGLRKLGAVYDGGETLKDEYKNQTAKLKKEREAFRKEMPKTALAAEIAGGITTGGAGLAKTGVLKGAQALSPLARTARVAGVGAIEGGLYGFGSADDGERIASGAKGAAVGAVAAPVGAKVADTAVKIGGAISRPIGAMFRSGKDDAIDALRKTAVDEGLDADEIVKRLDGLGEEGALADVGDAFNRLLRVSTDNSNEIARKAKQATLSRQIGQQDRLKRAARIATGKNGDDYRDTIAEMMRRRQEQAGPLYEEAWVQPFEITPKITDIIDRLGVHMKKGKRLARIEGESLERSTLKTLHYAKISLDNEIGKKMRSGEKVHARALLKLKRDLLDNIKQQNKLYGEASSIFSSEAQSIEAARLGRNILKGDVDDIKDAFALLSKSDVEAFRAGAIKSFENKLDNVGETFNSQRRFFNTKDTRERLRLAFGENYDDMIKAANKEEAFSATRAALGGSQTSANLKGGDELHGFVESLATGDAKAGVIRGLGKILRINRDKPQLFKEIGDLLLDRGLGPDDIRDIFSSSDMRDAIGESYDRVVLPYIQGVSAIPVASVSAQNY